MNANVHFDFSIPTKPEELTLALIKKKLEKKASKLRHETENLQSISANSPATPCDIYDISWLFNEKCKMIDFLKNESKTTAPDLPETDVELYINLYETLVKENDQQLQLLEFKKRELQEEKSVLAELKESLHLMKTNMNSLQTSENVDPERLDLNLLKKNSSIKFQEVRKDLHMVLDSCFIDNNFTQLIQELTEAYFKGGDEKYIEIIDNVYAPHIKLLKWGVNKLSILNHFNRNDFNNLLAFLLFM
ncbi:hypothetical protein CBL_05658 [Carabus blaptoides fortunei]